MKITIIYDNETCREDLKADWGFACLVEVYGKNILFDTGAKGDILLENMKILGLGGNDPGTGWNENYDSLFGPGSGYDGSFGPDSGPSGGHDISGPGSGETERSYKTIIGY